LDDHQKKVSLEYAIRKVHAVEECLKLNGTYQLLVYDDNVITLDGSIHTIQKNTEALIVFSKEISVEVNAEQTKYMIAFQSSMREE
jgi:hypothetical protein